MSKKNPLPKQLNPWQQSTPYGYTLAGLSHSVENATQRAHLLHGTGFSALTLAEMARNLPQSWSLCITDLPGHGQSQQPFHRMPDWQEMASAVYHAVEIQMNVSQLGPIVAIGHSLGGVLTLMAAAQHPELFKRVILLDPPLFNRPVMTMQKLLRKTKLWQHSPVVKPVINRRSFWPNTSEMKEYLSAKALYRHWQPQVLDDFCRSATVATNDGVRLACDPHWEGQIFGSYPKGLWNKIKKVGVKVDIVTAQKSYPFIRPSVNKAIKLNSAIKEHRFGARHCFPMEQPKQSADFVSQLLAG